MQVVRLIKPGQVDRIIAFDELPERLLRGIEKREPKGLPRHWTQFAKEHYYLEYDTLNAHEEKWKEIVAFVRRAVDPAVRLLDNIHEMALPMAPDSYQNLSLEPEDVVAKALIPIPAHLQEKAPVIAVVSASASIPAPVVEEPRADGKAKHTCKNLGRGGRFEEPGVCGRCDHLRAEKLVTA
jgi:hypothetical protein